MSGLSINGDAQARLRLGQDDAAYARLDITHNLHPGRRWMEIVFSLDAPLTSVKDKLYRHTGSNPSNIKVFLKFTPEDPGRLLLDPTQTLRAVGCVEGCILHVVDESGEAGVIPSGERTENLEGKYVMDDETYDKRDGTARKFLARLQKQQPDLFSKKEEKIEEDEESWKKRLDSARTTFAIGTRCRLSGDRRGAVAYVGPRPSKSLRQIWIGVALDEPLGCTDGRDDPTKKTPASQKVLFECNGDNYGEFVEPDQVEVGAFPPIDPFDLLDEI
ncbi:CAP-Gly domain-containing protein [Toxoplasma gondii RUB]|uniref:CAP-Gly domain-containing protein n=9 Tax=Toxoplasma gondii TaxID=5811 RepID=S7VWI7_TOXGG|nr:CAP-Gly domain-containing protein [Toxoplasma gondii GT1]KAF4644689.1 CAP-Gly domain-containing protein [Toxoplasma gondii]KFG28429.1 CAP-Gly domain-containing protein [Toxoplasma gondii p89]KFG33247.1 CAP-Gly domain-containing protein [Toxoplasma gondii GAB2-2007-GAL-DOM2]KFG45474.1 CAP-Gly domain-containing protein [Toxoplasma gondii FOU]KFG59233.1 CAP-Gly domain-containing protein [Toxoplasma gondii RUB]KFH06989.1 CAP-Gly domain-containing protein [Toxoplasma gondii MAS]PUA85961.1 CAP-